MKKTGRIKTYIYRVLGAMFMLFSLMPCGIAEAQNKSDKQGERVAVVDDEECGCELYFVDGIQTIQRDGHFGFKLEDGTVIVEPQYLYVDKFHDGYCIVYNDSLLCGLIDRNGKTVVPVIFEEINYPTDGMIRVRKNNLYGFYGTDGKQAIDCQYRTASGFSEGLATVIIDYDSITFGYGFIDKGNNLVLPAVYQYAFTFSEGYAIVKLYDRFGMIDRQGKEVLPIKYIELTPMHDSRFFAVDAMTSKAAMFDNRFRQLTPFKYDKVTAYTEGYYVVGYNGKMTFLDVKGREKFGLHDDVGGFVDGYSYVANNGKYGIINTRGKTILPIEYDNSGYNAMAYYFSEDLAIVEKDEKFGFVNKRGEVVIPIVYEAAHHCTEGLIPVKKNGVWGYIDKKGNLVCDFMFDAASYFEWGRAEIAYRSEVYKINTEGKCVKNCKKFPKEIKFKCNN